MAKVGGHGGAVHGAERDADVQQDTQDFKALMHSLNTQQWQPAGHEPGVGAAKQHGFHGDGHPAREKLHKAIERAAEQAKFAKEHLDDDRAEAKKGPFGKGKGKGKDDDDDKDKISDSLRVLHDLMMGLLSSGVLDDAGKGASKRMEEMTSKLEAATADVQEHTQLSRLMRETAYKQSTPPPRVEPDKSSIDATVRDLAQLLLSFKTLEAGTGDLNRLRSELVPGAKGTPPGRHGH